MKTRRWLALDVFRGVAVLLMIQGHTFTVLTHESELEQMWGSWYSLLHGLTAPMFLLGAGLAYGVVTLRRGRQGAPDPRLVRRGLLLIVLGYALQFPIVPWSRLIASRELYTTAASVGPLQLVGLCLLLCELVRTLARTRRARLWVTAALTSSVTASAPLVWQARFSDRSPLWLASWLDGYANSQFPIFPWAAFLLLGLLLCVPVLSLLDSKLDNDVRAGELRLGRTLVLGGFAAAALAYLSFVNGYVLRNVYGAYELWYTSPLYVAFRAGMIAIWLGVLTWLEPQLVRAFQRAPVAARLFAALSKQSLVAYVTHLLLLYGTPFTVGLKALGKLDLTTVGFVFAFVLSLTTAIAVLWEHFVASGAFGRAFVESARKLRALALGEVHGVGERERLDVGAPE